MDQQLGLGAHGGGEALEEPESHVVGVVVQDAAEVVNTRVLNRLWVRHVVLHDLDAGERAGSDLAGDLRQVLQDYATA